MIKVGGVSHRNDNGSTNIYEEFLEKTNEKEKINAVVGGKGGGQRQQAPTLPPHPVPPSWLPLPGGNLDMNKMGDLSCVHPEVLQCMAPHHQVDKGRSILGIS